VTGYIYDAVHSGSVLHVRGPYGAPFTVPSSGSRVLLVGGGSGVAPLHFLACVAREAGASCSAVLGDALIVAAAIKNRIPIVVSNDKHIRKLAGRYGLVYEDPIPESVRKEMGADSQASEDQ